MKRRRLLLFTLGAGLSTRAGLPRAQTSSAGMRRVGVLTPSTRAKADINLQPFFDQMRQLGWVEGQNIAYDRVHADDHEEMLGRFAAELVGRKPELIYAPVENATLAVKRATQTIPIVFGTVGDPVAVGLVTSLAHPGGNVTGIASINASLGPKRVQMLKEIRPGVKRIGRLIDPTEMPTTPSQELASVAASLGLTVVSAGAANPVELDAAVGRLVAEHVDAIFVGGTLIGIMHGRVIELALRKRVPVIGIRGFWADAGALFAYGPSMEDQLRRSAGLVDKVLNGARPADIPVEQPTLFELVVNLKTARALGIAIPQSVLLRADRVIE